MKKTKTERNCRGFTSWRQFVAMLFCQLGRAQSLREITGGLRIREGKLKHFGITVPYYSTLSYGNAHHLWELYQEIFFSLFARIRGQVNWKKKFLFKNKLLTLVLHSSIYTSACLTGLNSDGPRGD